jgi:putative FmdB family regulatory protein
LQDFAVCCRNLFSEAEYAAALPSTNRSKIRRYHLSQSTPREGLKMPLYEYICKDCGKLTEVKETLAEKEKGKKHACPNCGSKNVVQFFGNMQVIASTHLH